MYSKLPIAILVVVCLIVAPLVYGAFAAPDSASPCSCCQKCVCTNCTGDCDCAIGGPCVCPDGCCTTCCSR